jgi:hypothetical protein
LALSASSATGWSLATADRLLQHAGFAMRTIIIGTVLLIAVGVLGYSLVPDDTASESSQATSPQSGATSAVDIHGKLDELASALQSDRQSAQDQWSRIQSQQARLQRMLADFERRLRTVEATAAAPTTDAALSGSATEGMDIDAGQVETEDVSEVDLSRWMDEILRVEYVKQDSTELATEQVLNSLETMPGVLLDAMQCGESFCRATFAHENGGQPDIDALFGGPPFEGESFTVHDPDGRVTLYFTVSGGSLEAFRSEARQVMRAGSWQ